MRLLFSTAAALGLCAVLLVIAACNPEAYSGRANANKAAPPAAPNSATNPPPAPTAAPAEPADDVRRITVAELKQALDAHQAIVVDVRGDAAYKSGHIRDSIMIPFAEIGTRANELPKDKLIVTYCS
ncbi:MAG TPA: rhodanese-like domain-containing protein [Pyrinomonadaceae bacterium]|jgi:hypothetical protein